MFSHLVVLYERLLFRFPWRKVVCVSQSLKERLLRDNVVSKESVVIYNGIDTHLFTPRHETLREQLGFSEKDTIFVYAGRPSPLKGTDLIIKALPSLFKAHPDLHVAFFVPAQDEGNWEIFLRTLKDHPAQVHVFEARPHEDMPAVYAMADLILIPSRSEGFCFQAAEASAMDCPVLCPHQDSFPEVVSGKVIFTPLTVEGVRDGMERYFKKDWEILPKKHFSWSTALEKWAAVYEQLIS